MIVWNERSLCRILRSYFDYYEGSRTNLALAKDAPVPRVVEQHRKRTHRGYFPGCDIATVMLTKNLSLRARLRDEASSPL